MATGTTTCFCREAACRSAARPPGSCWARFRPHPGGSLTNWATCCSTPIRLSAWAAAASTSPWASPLNVGAISMRTKRAPVTWSQQPEMSAGKCGSMSSSVGRSLRRRRRAPRNPSTSRLSRISSGVIHAQPSCPGRTRSGSVARASRCRSATGTGTVSAT